MLSFSQLNLRRYVLFDDVEFKFKKGVTMVGGANRSGKSLLFHSLHDALYRKESGEIPPTNSIVEFGYKQVDTDGSTDYRFISQSSKLSFFENGEDRQPHKMSDAISLLRQSINISHPLYTSTVWLRGTKEHDLLMGKPSSRAEWLSGVLDLTTVYDSYFDQVNDKLDELRHRQTEYTTLKSELEEVTNSLPTAPMTSKEADALREKYDMYLSRMRDMVERITDIKNKIEQLSRVPSVTSDKSPKEVRKLIRITSDALTELKSQYKKAKQHEEYSGNVDRLNELASRLGRHLSDPRGLTAKISKCEREVEEYNEALETYESQTDYRRKFEALSPKFLKKYAKTYVKDIDRINVRRKELESKMAFTTEMGEELNEIKEIGSKCPTCNSVLDTEHVRKELKSLKAKYREYSEEFDRLAVLRDKLELMTMKFVPKPDNACISKLEVLKKLDKYMEEYLELKRDMPEGEVPKVSSDDLRKSMKKLTVELERLEEEYSAAVKVQTFKDDAPAWLLKVYNSGDVKGTVRALKAELEEVTENRDALSEKVDKMNYKLTCYSEYRNASKLASSTTNRLKDKLGTLEQELKDYEAWKALRTAFDKSGLRMSELKTSADVLSAKMTELSPLFFSEQYAFNIEVAPRKLELLIERNGRSSGLSKLSGSESRMFSLLFSMSLMYLLPHRLRSDTIILDELEANLDAAARDRYSMDIIPELQVLAPKVVVVTPLINGELNIQPDRFFRVEKYTKGGKVSSRLIDG